MIEKLDNITDIELYKDVLENTAEEVFVFDDIGQIIYANEAARRETQYTDLTNVSIHEIYPYTLRADRKGIFWDENETKNGMHTFAYRENRTCYPVKIYCRHARMNDENVIVAYAVNDAERYEAVREHNEAMEDVKAATKMKDEFTANITHELRTPINGIKGMTEGLADTQLTPEQRETVNIILHCCDNMTHIINDILDFSKIEAGKLTLENREFSMTKFINDNLSMHITKVNEKGLKLVVNVMGTIPELVVGDELRLGQVLNNLFSNAIKFTSSGQICLEVSAQSTGPEETEFFFMVIDSGIGIDEEEQKKLFQSFSQVDGSITRRYGGTGLGLAITKQLVELMGGTINVKSEKGKGSTFFFNVKLKNGSVANMNAQFPEGSFVFTKNIPMAARLSASEEQEYSEAGEEFLEEQTAESELYEVRDDLEKLAISIELGGWEKAENFASTVKNLLSNSEEHREVSRKAFALLLNVRKEKYEASMELIEEIKEMLNEF